MLKDNYELKCIKLLDGTKLKCLKYFAQIEAEKIIFWTIREEVQLGDFVAFLYEVVFLIDRGLVVARPVQREDSCE